MEIDLRGIQEGTHPVVLDGRDSVLTVDEEGGQRLARYRFEGAITLAGKDCQVRGSLAGALETACDRCLARFDREIRTELDAQTVVKDPGSPERGDGPILDLAGPLREAVLLEIPIKNLCSGECRGICPRCGVNRNVESCDCAPRKGDPRWDTLKGLSFSSEPEE